MEEVLNSYGFRKLHKSKFKEDEVDTDRVSHIKRIGDVHYLLFSMDLKIFSLAVRYDKPKGQAGGGYKEYNMVVIPKIINTPEDAAKLLNVLI